MKKKKLAIPESVVLDMLKCLPEDVLADMFWKAMVFFEDDPLSKEEEKSLAAAKADISKGRTVKWQDMK